MKNKKFNAGVLTGVVGTLLVVGLMFGITLYKNKDMVDILTGNTKTSKTIEESGSTIISKIKFLMSIIDEQSIYEPDDEDVIDGIYKGIFASLDDDYATYYTKEEYEKFLETATGEYVGIGAYVSMNDNGHTYIVSPIKGSPADKAGLKTGDVFYKVNGKVVTDKDTDEIVAMLKGKENTDVTVEIARDGEDDYLEFTLTRKKIESITVAHKVIEEDNVGYIQVASFDDVTVKQFNEALTELTKKKVDGIVVDLRNNPGGNLDVVVEMLDMFLPKDKMIVYTKNKAGDITSEYKAKDNKYVNLPMCVLINGNSASASEIFAANVKDHKLGKLVGETTFGKGIVQTVSRLTDGSAIKFTTAKYFTPNGVDIHKKGVEPDVEIELNAEDYKNKNIDSQLNVAIQQLKKK